MKMRVRLPHGNLVKQYFYYSVVGTEFYCRVNPIAIVFLLEVLPCLNKARIYVCMVAERRFYIETPFM